jgi:hypothetical protein
VSIRRTLLRVLLGGALLGGGVLAGTGGLALGGPGLVAVGLAAALAACMAAGIVREAPERARGSAVEAAVWAAGSTLGVMLVVAGIATLAGGVVAAVAVAAGVVAVVVLQVVRGRGRRTGTGTRPLATRGPTTPAAGVVLRLPVAPSAPEEVAVMSTGDLGDEWLLTTAALTGRLDPAIRQSLVARREAVLDELERRDPDGFTRWLADAPTRGSNPADFVRGGPARRGPVAGTDAA